MIDAKTIRRIRGDVHGWFNGFARVRDERSQQPVMVAANVLQRRMFEYYYRCQKEGKPCRMVVLKYRRAGSSSASAAMNYVHNQNYESRSACIGTDYRSAVNIMDMVAFYAQHDDFPGWRGTVKEAAFEAHQFETAGGPTLTKTIATRLEFATGSTIELFTSQNPEACRSAGMNAIHSTEVGRWATGGALDAAETLASVRNALPKSGFHLCIEESTGAGASGAFYDTCRKARWPGGETWPDQWRSDWPLNEEDHADLQPVLIFAGWHEDERNVYPLTEQQARKIEDTLDAEEWYRGEKDLIARYGQDGPKGKRLGSEVNATAWEQLAWRRTIIRDVCTRRGLDEFKQEYPASPLEAFQASGAPVFSLDGITALDLACRSARKPETGIITKLPSALRATFDARPEAESLIQIWEKPIPGCRYLISVDPKKDSEIVKGTGERDRNGIIVIRDAYKRTAAGRTIWYPVKVVAMVKPPNYFDDAPVAHIIAQLATYYGGCVIVVESNLGPGLITRLRDEHFCNLYAQENWDMVRQRAATCYGWNTNDASRRQAVSELQENVREQTIEILSPEIIAELKTFVFSSKGKAEAAVGAHDDLVMALAIGLCCLPHATTFTEAAAITVKAPDEDAWKGF